MYVIRKLLHFTLLYYALVKVKVITFSVERLLRFGLKILLHSESYYILR